MILKGRGTQSIIHNKFEKAQLDKVHIEGIDEEQLLDLPKTKIFQHTSSTIVNKVTSPDIGINYSLNPYQGCEHGCIYCYARPTHEYWGFNAGLDFESKIVVKKDAPQQLERFLLNPKWHASPIVLSGNTDCYQPLERKHKITRSLLEVFLKYRHPVGVITKNALITRDLDIIKELARLRLIHVVFSITTLDEKLRNILEPRTSTIASKLKAMEALAAVDVPITIMMAPIIPSINHHEIPSLIKTVSEHGASKVSYTTIRLNGPVGSLFTDWLSTYFPDRKDKVLHQIAALHGGEIGDSRFDIRMKGEGKIADVIKKLFDMAHNKYIGEVHIPPYNLNIFRRGGHYQLF